MKETVDQYTYEKSEITFLKVASFKLCYIAKPSKSELHIKEGGITLKDRSCSKSDLFLAADKKDII